MVKRVPIFVAAISAAAFLCASAPASAEVTLRVVSAFPKTELIVADFLKYIEAVNKEGKGVVQIRYLGGPEIANPREMPVGMRKGLYEMIYSPTAYYLGLFPEGDMMFGFKTPMERRANGHIAEMDKALRQKLDATIIAHFGGSLGVNLWTTKEPKLTPSGRVDLTGLKIRTSPAYRDFVRDLGGTPVVLPGTAEVYTALERGTVDGTGLPIAQARDTKIERLVKFLIEPDAFKTVILLTADAKKMDALPAKAQEIVRRLGVQFERSSYEAIQKKTDSERAELVKAGVKVIDQQGAAGKEYKDIFLKSAWERVRGNKQLVLDPDKMYKLAY